MPQITLSNLDIAVIIFYFLILGLITYYVHKSTKTHSEDYFLAGRNLGWFAIGASIFASNIGSEHLVGLAGAGASSGLAVGHFEILGSLVLLLLGWLFVPFYLKSAVTTMPEFLERRYGPSARIYLSIISVLGYILTKISVTIYASGIIFEAIGFDFWTGAISIVVVTGIYTTLGGLKAVIYTDMMQMFIILLGSIFLTIFGIQHLGGVTELIQYTPSDYFQVWKPMNHPDFPWTGILLGAPILGVWYWCTDQFIVQRVLSAKNLSQARKGTIFSGYLKILPLFLFVFPGVICAALSAKGSLELQTPDHALPTMISFVMPTGLKGLVVAGLFAALMSSLSSVFNSCSTLITYDFFKKIQPQASEKTLITIGQITTVILISVGILWIPFMGLISEKLFQYLQSIQAYISPPIAAVFLLGLFIPRVNQKGAMAALYLGFIIGISKIILEVYQGQLGGLLYDFATINFLHFAFFLFCVCSFVLVTISYIFPTHHKSTIQLMNIKTLLAGDEKKKDRYTSVILIMCILGLWYVFR